MELPDRDLVEFSRGGDAQALAMLLARHQAAMRAVAVARLSPGPDVEDVVQEANLVAITSLDRLRDPDSVGSWLTGITRNLCRQRSRVSEEPLIDQWWADDDGQGPEERLDQLALGDWVWTALDTLSEPLRDALVLRYFSSASSYQSIARVLEIPVGTVRSRLSDARRALAQQLRALEDSAHPDRQHLERERSLLFAGITEEYNRGTGLDLLRSALSADARLTGDVADSTLLGRESIVRGLSEDIEVGVRLQLLNVIAGQNLTVVEGAFLNPPDHPDHCPPLTTQVMRHNGDGISSIRLHYSWA